MLCLSSRFGDGLNAGQRQHLAQELKEERLWEEYAEIGFHEELFNVACILNLAFPKEFPEADMVKIRLKAMALSSRSAGNLQNLNASFIARLLNDGMDEHNTIYRLFGESIASNLFPEAEDVIWNFTQSEFSENELSVELIIYTSWNWVDELKGVRHFESAAYSDRQLH